jgi:hypothetical protein
MCKKIDNHLPLIFLFIRRICYEKRDSDFYVVLLGSLAFSVQAAQFEYKLAHVYAPEHPLRKGWIAWQRK